MRWATLNRAEAFDLLAPPAAARSVVAPICRITTLRSPGTIDERDLDFAITLVENCDNTVSGELFVVDKRPLVYQLADIRSSHPQWTISEAARTVAATRRTLTATEARKLRHHLAAISFALLPPMGIPLDTTEYELMSNTSMEKTIVALLDASGPAERQRALAEIRAVTKLLKLTRRQVPPRTSN